MRRYVYCGGAGPGQSWKAIYIILFIVVSTCLCSRDSNEIKGEFSINDIKAEKPVVLTEDMVVFIVLSQEDSDSIERKDPSMAGIIGDKVFDFMNSADKISKSLRENGIRIDFAVAKRISFRFANGRVETKRFKPRDIYARALFAKGKRPKLASNFGAWRMELILSKYFGKKIVRE